MDRTRASRPGRDRDEEAEMYRWYWFRKLQLGETDLEEPGAAPREAPEGTVARPADPVDAPGGVRRTPGDGRARHGDVEEAA